MLAENYVIEDIFPSKILDWFIIQFLIDKSIFNFSKKKNMSFDKRKFFGLGKFSNKILFLLHNGGVSQLMK